MPKFVDNCLHVVSASLGIALHEITLLVFFSQTLHAYTTVLLTCQTAAWPKHSLSTFFLTSVFPILYGCWNSPKSPDITGHVYSGSIQKARSRACDSLIASPSHSMTMAHCNPRTPKQYMSPVQGTTLTQDCPQEAAPYLGDREESSAMQTQALLYHLLTRPESRGWTRFIY